jgi:hypothetical protein
MTTENKNVNVLEENKVYTNTFEYNLDKIISELEDQTGFKIDVDVTYSKDGSIVKVNKFFNS